MNGPETPNTSAYTPFLELELGQHLLLPSSFRPQPSFCVRACVKDGDTSLCFLCVYDVYRMICEKVRREFGYEKGFETGDGYTKPRYASAWPVPGS